MTLKLKRTPGLYLVGFMGCGKSTIGRVLADQLGWPFHDIDADIKRKRVRLSPGSSMNGARRRSATWKTR